MTGDRRSTIIRPGARRARVALLAFVAAYVAVVLAVLAEALR